MKTKLSVITLLSSTLLLGACSEASVKEVSTNKTEETVKTNKKEEVKNTETVMFNTGDEMVELKLKSDFYGDKKVYVPEGMEAKHSEEQENEKFSLRLEGEEGALKDVIIAFWEEVPWKPGLERNLRWFDRHINFSNELPSEEVIDLEKYGLQDKFDKGYKLTHGDTMLVYKVMKYKGPELYEARVYIEDMKKFDNDEFVMTMFQNMEQ
ncbi:hypothetical protein QTG56_24750 (plasmid) [Rossellomorea sp. AcN35-11]|nr:hypothetical protein [Rossellomorea aquimaris]WJV31845.1 hypothetical protein QTG56_24750 [Rossellomorea sp. AcN35-11]